MNAIIRYATILMACTLSFTPSIKDAIAFQPGCNASPARGEELPAATPLQPSRLFASGPITGATDPSEVKTGYAIVLPPSGRPAPNGVLVFSLAQDSILVSEAGVPASSPPTSWAQLFVDVQNPSINTGIAVANPYDRPANLTLRLSDVENRPLSSANLPTIPAGGQIARFVTELLPSVHPAPGGVFRGVLTISSDVPVSIVALRLTFNERHETLLTAFPVADQNLRKGPSSLPQVASGGGFKTQLLLLNPIAGSLSGTVDFFDSSGSPLSLPIGGRTVSSLRYSIPPGGAFFAETDGTGSLSSGWARVLPDGDDLAPAAMAVFSFRSRGILTSEAAVPAPSPARRARMFVEYGDLRNTGIAVSNPQQTSLELQLDLVSAENPQSVFASAGLQLSGRGQTARYVSQLFPSLPKPFRGRLEMKAAAGFTVIALRQTLTQRDDLLFTTFPVADLDSPPLSVLEFPHLAIGGGYNSEIILVDTAADPAQANVSSAEPDGGETLTPDPPYTIVFRAPNGTGLVVFMDGTYCTNCNAALPAGLAASELFPTLVPPNVQLLTTKMPAIDMCNPGPYNACMVVTGGVPPYIAALLPGSSLPPGLVLTPAGCVAGNPLPLAPTTAERLDVFTVQVAGPPGSQAVGELSILTKNCLPVFELPTVLPDAYVGIPYVFPMLSLAHGGFPPYHFVKETASQFPPFGIVIEPVTGFLAGTPTAQDKRYFTVCAVDTIGNNKCMPTSLRVRPSYNLIVALNGSGHGQVQSGPDGIQCGSRCAAVYPVETQVTLLAFPEAGSTFTGWSGACSGSEPCVLRMDSEKWVTANFSPAPAVNPILRVTKTGSGSGTVSTAPAGINCGTTCAAGYSLGTQVTLTAAPAAGSTFTGWSGACSGAGTCVVTMNADKGVTAIFATVAPANRSLTVSRSGAGSGTVTSSPAGVNCGSACSASYPAGTQVTLGAAAASGSTFTGWSGGCSGAGTCNLTMNADLSVVADFAASPPPTIAGKWQGTFGTQALSFCPAQSGTWTATIDVGDGVITGTWYDSYNDQIMVLNGTFDGTTARWFSGGGDERIDYTARFSGDRVQGTTSGPLCTTESGKIQGAFTGSRVVP